MSLNPVGYRKTTFTHRRGNRVDQPAANTVLPGTLFYVIDDGLIEQSDGTSWSAFSGAGSRSSTITNYSYSATLSSPPGTNQIRFNAAHPYTTVTKIYIWNINADGQDLHAGLLLVQAGSIILVQDKNDNTRFGKFQTTSDPISHTTWVEYNVVHIDHGLAIGGGQLVLVQSNGGPTYIPPIHHTSHETGGTDVITAIDASVINSGILSNSRLPVFTTPTFNAADFTTITGTWTVTSLSYNTYIRIGNLLVWSMYITVSTLSSGANIVLLIKLPAGMTTSASGGSFQFNCPFAQDSVGTQKDYIVQVRNSNTVQINRFNNASIPVGSFGIQFTIFMSVN